MDYSNKITLFNAKEKLLSHVKMTNLTGDMSNKWNFIIDLVQVKEDEETEFRKVKNKILIKNFFIAL